MNSPLLIDVDSTAGALGFAIILIIAIAALISSVFRK